MDQHRNLQCLHDSSQRADRTTSLGTTSNSTNLSWTASTVAVNCVLTGYTVFKNGVAVGTTSSPNMTVTGLSPVTTYSFRVAATDAAGSSAQSAAINVKTLKGPPPPPPSA